MYMRGPTISVFWSRPTDSDVLYTGLGPFDELGFLTHLAYWSGPTLSTFRDPLGVLGLYPPGEVVWPALEH